MKKIFQTFALALAFAAPAMIAAPAAHAASQDAGGYRVVHYGPARYHQASYWHNHHRYEHRSVRRVCHHGHCRRVVRYW